MVRIFYESVTNVWECKYKGKKLDFLFLNIIYNKCYI